MKDDSFIEDMTASLSQEDLCRYSALSIDFANVKVVTRKCCKNIDKVPGSDFSTSFVCSIATDMSSHLYSHPEDNRQDNTSSDINSLNLIDPFPLRVDLSQRKLDSADASFESSVSVTDFASKLTTVHSNKSVHLLTRFCNHYESAIKLINEFRLSLQKETSMLLLPERFSFPDTTNDIKQISAKSLPLDSANDCLKYNQSKGSRFNSILTSSSTSQQEMISEMSQTLCSTQRDLHHLYQTSLLPAQSATAAIKDALLMCEELSEIAGKLHQASLLTACIDPTYCGWLRRSEGLLINPQSINTRECSSNWGIRSWAVLVRGSLLFMAKPYSSKVDFSIAMDSLFVSEPDESEAVALSSSIGSLEKSVSIVHFY